MEPPSVGLRLFRWLALVPLCAACAWSLLGPPSVEAGAFAMAIGVATFGAFARGRRRRRRWLPLGLAAAVAVVLLRIGCAAEGETLRSVTAPSGRPGRWLDQVVPERDLALGGSRLLLVTGLMPDDEPGLLGHLDRGFDRMRAAEGAVPSPVLGNLMLGQTPEAHGVLRVAPAATGRDDAALVFLHGYMGSVTLLCWQVAQAASPVGLPTVCPAMDWHARWASPEGRAIVAGTLAELRAQGVDRIYLAGLSAGAVGASRLAGQLDLDGVILISGASRQARPARVPTLVLHGARDRMAPPAPARRYASRLGARARYVEVEDAGHWLVLSHDELVRGEIEGFLRAQESR